jgi:hypothetical protein
MFKALGNDAANSAFEALLPRGRLSGEVSEVFLDDSDGEEDVEGSRVALSQHGSVGESASEAVLLPKGGGRPTANPCAPRLAVDVMAASVALKLPCECLNRLQHACDWLADRSN